MGKSSIAVAACGVLIVSVTACGSSGHSDSGKSNSSGAGPGNGATTTGVSLPSIPIAGTWARDTGRSFSIDNLAGQITATKGDSTTLPSGSWNITVTERATATLKNTTDGGRVPQGAPWMVSLVPIYKKSSPVCGVSSDAIVDVTGGSATSYCAVVDRKEGSDYVQPSTLTWGAFTTPDISTSGSTYSVGPAAQTGTSEMIKVEDVKDPSATITALQRPDAWMIAPGDHDAIKTVVKGQPGKNCTVEKGVLRFSDDSSGEAVTTTSLSC